MIISILLLVAIPNMTNNNDIASQRGCEATIDLLQAQVGAYYVEKKEYPKSLEDLKGKYVDTIVCPNGTELTLNTVTRAVEVK
ncbi:competence type IV pilus major pilin ComGC [Anaerobacillus sp. CMMVII]|uniref:competence type IV pilus major pilin ComGC n=1 Tax=Anaerobacillus sp. CMMVII TaxID=2755588 RepID=UPI0021B7D99C|nr:competence protein ComG [Anaerobacillus sp. CMMVII]